MQREELKTLFDQQAAGYDKQWEKTAPMRNGLHFLLESVFAGLPTDARILCVGVGTGAEIAHLAQHFPHWHFTAVDPSGKMLDACRQRAAAEGFLARCEFHEGYVESLPTQAPYHGATCFLVSQFILDQAARTAFFQAIADRLLPGGILASSDLAADVTSADYEAMLRLWLTIMAKAEVSPERVEQMRQAYAKDVAILPPQQVAALITSSGFQQSVQFYQTGLIHAWASTRA